MRHRPRGIQLSHPPALSAHCSAVSDARCQRWLRLACCAVPGACAVRGSMDDGCFLFCGGGWGLVPTKGSALQGCSPAEPLAVRCARSYNPSRCGATHESVLSPAVNNRNNYNMAGFSPVVVCACESVRGALGSSQQLPQKRVARAPSVETPALKVLQSTPLINSLRERVLARKLEPRSNLSRGAWFGYGQQDAQGLGQCGMGLGTVASRLRVSSLALQAAAAADRVCPARLQFK